MFVVAFLCVFVCLFSPWLHNNQLCFNMFETINGDELYSLNGDRESTDDGYWRFVSTRSVSIWCQYILIQIW